MQKTTRTSLFKELEQAIFEDPSNVDTLVTGGALFLGTVWPNSNVSFREGI